MKKKLNSDVVFIGWQKNHLEDSFALYNIVNKDHPFNGSTVSEKTIKKLNLKMPEQNYYKGRKDISSISRKEAKLVFYTNMIENQLAGW